LKIETLKVSGPERIETGGSLRKKPEILLGEIYRESSQAIDIA
jgi:hypothetical protein